jgi:pimeloyl-ACP methyl ester carboxylesterase
MTMNYQARGKYLAIEPGVEIFYIDIGQGDPIVLIPGLTFSTEIFKAQIEYFSKTNRVIAIDPRGQGRSSKSTHGNDYTTHGQDLAKIIELLALDNITLLGWSTGNLTIWSYVNEFDTKKIKSVILIDMSPKPSSPNENDWVEGNIDELGAAMTAFLTTQEGQRAFFTDYATQVMVQRTLSDEELFAIIDMSSRTPYYITQSLFANAVLGDFREGCKKLNDNVPTIMFIADHWSKIAQPYMNSNYPKIKTCVMGGHLLFWEYSEKFNAEVEDFMTQLGT